MNEAKKNYVKFWGVSVLGGAGVKIPPPLGVKKCFTRDIWLQIGSYESPLKNKKNDTKIMQIGHTEAEL